MIEELVCDNLIEKDKIGAGNYFWSFPSKAITVRQTKINAVENQIKELESKVESKFIYTTLCSRNFALPTIALTKQFAFLLYLDLTTQKRKLEETREDTIERETTLTQLNQQNRIAKQLEEELTKYAANDPEKIKQLAEWSLLAKSGANRWTDNIHEMLAFFKKRMNNFDEVQLLKHLELPEDIDSVE